MKSLKHGFANASYLSIGNLISQIIAFIGVVFIARLFGPDKYGIYTTVIAYVTFFHLFVFSGLLKVVVREGCKDLDTFSAVLSSTIGLRMVLIGLALVLSVLVCFFTKYPVSTKVMIIIFSSEIIYFGLDSFLKSIYQATEKMQYLAFFSVLTRILVSGLSIAFLYLGASILIILLVNLLSKFFVLFLNYFKSKKIVSFRFNIWFNTDIDFLKATAVFSLIGFINTFAVKIDLLMISFLSTSKDVGIYGVAHELTREGLMLKNITAMAFFPIAVKFLAESQLEIRKVLHYSAILFAIVGAGCLVLSFFVKDLVVLFFGSNYIQSGFILKNLLFCLPFAFFCLPLTTYFQASHKEHILLIVFSMAAAANIPLNVIFFHQFGLVGIAYSTIIVFILESIVLSFYASRIQRKQVL